MRDLCYNYKTVLLRDKINYEDYSIFSARNQGNELFSREVSDRQLYYVFGFINLLEVEYVNRTEVRRINDLGYRDNMIDKNVISAGLAISSNKYLLEPDAYTYCIMMSYPLLTTPNNYFSFCSMFYNSVPKFLNYFVRILSQVPCFWVGKTNQGGNFKVIGLTMAEVLHITFGIEWNVIIREVRGQNVNFTHNALPPILANDTDEARYIRNSINNLININYPGYFGKAIYEKCLKSWDKTFTNGFFLIESVRNRVEWVTGTDLYNVLQANPQDINGRNTFRGKIYAVLKPKLSSIGFAANELQGIEFEANVNYYNYAEYLNGMNYNPLGAFGSVEDDDFLILSNLIVSFFPIYHQYYRNLNVTYPFLGALVNFCYSKTKIPNYVGLYDTIYSHFNEVISRKLFKMIKAEDYTYIKSSPDYTYVFVCPMNDSEYSLKWYLKRDFSEFFKFFDSVYYKPKYLKLLSPSGLGILKKLSKFDANVIESISTKTVPMSTVQDNN